EAGADAGDTLRVVMEPDTAPRELEVPEDLEAALKKDAAARSGFERMSYSNRKEYVSWILEARKAETRQSRIGKALVMIAAGKRLKG
ncbi:MAG: YdeI/OmpD-associated family protein, partial [Myxococcaceae bacterium]|nr:YdeI/OmpD-associated family protein [Myxococcaceae bacterium]